MSGQSRKKPELGLLEQAFEPPPQLGMPELPIREAPISNITVPERIISFSCDKKRVNAYPSPWVGRYVAEF